MSQLQEYQDFLTEVLEATAESKGDRLLPTSITCLHSGRFSSTVGHDSKQFGYCLLGKDKRR